MWAGGSILLLRQIDGRHAALSDVGVERVAGGLHEAQAVLVREATLLAQDPAVMDAAYKGDWATLARGAARLRSLTLDRVADLVVVQDVGGASLLQVPPGPRVQLPSVPAPMKVRITLATLEGHAYLLAAAAVGGAPGGGLVIVGRRAERLDPNIAGAGLVIVDGDMLRYSTLADAPVTGWASATAAGRRELVGEPWRLRSVGRLGRDEVWVAVRLTEAVAERRVVARGLLAGGVLAVALTAALVVVLTHRRPRAARPGPAPRPATPVAPQAAAIATDHARLVREASEQAERMRALAELSRVFAGTLDPDIVSERIADSVRRLFPAVSASLFRVEPDSGDLVPVASSSGRTALARPIPVLPRGIGITGLAAESRRVVVSADVGADPRIEKTEALREWITAVGGYSAIALPLIVNDVVVGVLSVSGERGRVFGAEDTRLAQTFADQAALALANARLYAESAQRRTEAEELARLARTLTESLDVSEVVERTVQSVLPLFRVQSSVVRRLQADGSLLALAVGGGGGAHFTPGHVLPAGVGVLGRAVAEGRAVATPDALTDGLVELSDDLAASMRASGEGSVLAVPMRAKGVIIGALGVMDRRGRVFGEREAALLQAFADQATLALENARLFGSERTRREQIAALADVERELAAMLDPERLPTRIVERATGLFEASGALYILEEDGGLVRRAWTGQDVGHDRLAPGEGFAGLAIRERRGLLSNDYARSPNALPVSVAGGVRTAIVQPLIVRDRPLGALAMSRIGDAATPFTVEDLALLQSFAAHAAIAIDNAELARQTRAKLVETQTLLSVSRALSSTQDLQALLRHLLKAVTTTLGADCAGAWLVQDDGEWMEPVAGYRIPPERLDAFRSFRLSLLKHAFYAEAARTRRPVFTSDAMNDSRLPAFVQEQGPHRTQLFVPVVVNERLVAAFSAVWWDTAREVSADELALIEAIAAQAGVALESGRLFDENRRRLAELSVLHDLSRAVTGELDRGAVVEAVRVHAARVLDVGNIVVVLRDAEHDALEDDAGLMSIVLRTGRALRTDDYDAECRRHDVTPIQPSPELPHWLGVPMAAGEQVLGGIALRGRRAFADSDEQLLLNIAHLAALALRSVRLYDERARAYQELAAAQEQLVRTEKLRALGEMASGVAHDFNNLLAAILGRAQLLMRRVEEPQPQQWLRVIERSALDGAQTVRRLQEFTRIRRDQPMVAIDVTQVVRDALDITQSRWREEPASRGIVIELRTELGPVPPILGDAAELREALTNVILNAVDAMPTGGTLTLRTHVDAEYVEIVIADTGVGIPSAVRDKIFDPFFTTKGPKGTGLGLSLTYGIVSRHGGVVSVDSEEGHGSTFRLAFPIAAAMEPPPTAPPERREHGGSARTLRCLVVDDEEPVRAMLADAVEAAGHHATAVASGGEAVACFRAEPFDVVITDLAMPGVSGWQVARAVKHMAPHVPVLLTTGFGVELSAEERRTHGVDLVLVKPLQIEEIREALAAAARTMPPGRSEETPWPSST